MRRSSIEGSPARLRTLMFVTLSCHLIFMIDRRCLIMKACSLLLSTHSHDPSYWGESDVPACGPPASFSVHLASSAVTPAGSVHKTRGDIVVRMWVQLKR